MKYINILIEKEETLKYLGELINYCEINSKRKDIINLHVGLLGIINLYSESIIIDNKIDDKTYWFYSEDEKKTRV